MNNQTKGAHHLFRTIILLACTGLIAATPVITATAYAQEKPRVIVLSDISKGEPDDAQSLIRFLLYANEFDVEGLLATTSIWRMKAGDEIAPRLIRERVEAYGKVRDNLLQHASGYPRAEDLLPLIKTGRLADGMEGVGDGKNTEASRHILSVVDHEDPRPVWILAWGGVIDLAQALWDVKNTRSPAEVQAFVSKLRVYEIGGQDNAGAWIAHTFPEVFWIRSAVQFQGISRRLDGSSNHKEARGGNESIFTGSWVDEHIQSHGPLGELYPDARYKHEGDTPSILHLLPTGLAEPDQISYGNWGGRFEAEKQENPPAVEPVVTPDAYKPYCMYDGASDTWTYEEEMYENVYAPIFRWRTAFQHDLAARMDWSINPTYDGANHNPIAAFSKDTTTQGVQLKASPGDTISLNAAGSYDPDGDRLSYAWDQYKEPGTYDFVINIKNGQTPKASFVAPEVEAPTSIHIILTVTDDGEPSLYSYRRIIVLVEPE